MNITKIHKFGSLPYGMATAGNTLIFHPELHVKLYSSIDVDAGIDGKLSWAISALSFSTTPEGAELAVLFPHQYFPRVQELLDGKSGSVYINLNQEQEFLDLLYEIKSSTNFDFNRLSGNITPQLRSLLESSPKQVYNSRSDFNKDTPCHIIIS